MAEITMPKLSDTMTEGTLVRWKKNPGDQVSMGEIIAEVETDKATMEMEAFEDGVLSEVFVQEGQKVEVGQRIARIGEPGESPAPAGAKAATPPAAPAAEPAAQVAPEDGTDRSLAESPEKVTDERQKAEAKLGGAAAPSSAPAMDQATAPGDPNQRVKASPLARKIAQEHGVDIASLRGSGPGERIVQRDVLAAVEGKGNARPAPAPPAPAAAPSAPKPVAPTPAAPAARPPTAAPAPVATLADQRIPLTSMRKTIADRLLASKTQIPHFYLRIEVDAGPLVRLRKEINAAADADDNKFSVNDFILKATVAALVRAPKANASFQGDAIVQFGSVNLAVAVAIEDGLVTPVIRDAQHKSLREISLAVKDLAVRARSKKLKPEEYQGGTFTVSNLGSYGIDNFDAIINPPQAAILSVGALVKKPVVNDQDEIVVGHRLSLGLSCDHRVVDGAIGAEYLAALRRLLEKPALMLV